MRRSRRFISMPVISLEEGLKVGSVKGLVVDSSNKKVAALIIEQKGWFKEIKYIPYNKIRSVGDDAITVDRSAGAEKGSGLPDIIRLVKEKIEVNGSKLVSENGTVLGFVDEFFIDEESGNIAGLEFAGKYIDSVIRGRAYLDISFVRTIGKEVVVITAEGVENVLKLDGGLQETVKTIKESTGQIWGSTVQKTRELGSSINRSLDRFKADLRGSREEKEKNGEAAAPPTGNSDPGGTEAGQNGDDVTQNKTDYSGNGEQKTAPPPSGDGAAGVREQVQDLIMPGIKHR